LPGEAGDEKTSFRQEKERERIIPIGLGKCKMHSGGLREERTPEKKETEDKKRITPSESKGLSAIQGRNVTRKKDSSNRSPK